MSILGKLGFGKRSGTEASAEPDGHTETLPTGALLQRADPPAAETSRREMPATVRVHDEFGRELQIPIESWRTSMLPAALQKAFDEPDKLYGLIVDALGLKLGADVMAAAAHLYATDTNAERGAVIYSIVLMDVGKPEIAEKILSTYLAAHGPSGVVLTNLAKTLVALGREAEGDDALWRGLVADPNQENGLGWYAAMQKERHGEAAWGGAMQRVAALPGAWRPQVWLARLALKGGDKARAMGLYAEALERVERPVPTQVLQQISGDLGMQGMAAEAVALTQPVYVATFHGLAVGNNLIKAELELGDAAGARALVDELYRQQRSDWAENLNYWENEIRKQELAKAPALAEVRLTHYTFDGPVWLAEGSAGRELFPSASPRRAKVLLAGSTVSADASRVAGAEMPDATGRLSRAMPLFLAENVFMRLGLDTATSIPWVEHGGFAVLGIKASDAELTDYARVCGAAAVVAVHLLQAGADVTVEVRVLTVPQDAAELPRTLAAISTPVEWKDVGAAAVRMAESVVETLGKQFGGEAVKPALYVLPGAQELGNYLLRLEQLLAVRCARNESDGRRFLNGEREIVRGQLDMALRTPLSLPARLIVLETLRGLQKVQPAIAAEFRSQTELLETRYPMPDAQVNALLTSGLRGVFEG